MKEIEALVGDKAVAVPIVGAPGAVADIAQQVTEALRADGGDVIAGLSLFMAVTSNV
jgi:hypothetical protein